MNSTNKWVQHASNSIKLAEYSLNEGDIYDASDNYNTALSSLDKALKIERDPSARAFINRTIHDCNKKIKDITDLQLDLDNGDDVEQQVLNSKSSDRTSRVVDAENALNAAINLETRCSAQSDVIKAYKNAAEIYLSAVETCECKDLRESLLYKTEGVMDKLKELQRVESISDKFKSLPPLPTKIPLKVPSKEEFDISSTSSDGEHLFKLTPNEIEVLKKSSFVNGKVFMPWLEGEEVHERFKFSKPWSDPDGPLALNDKQSENLLGMLRPSEIVEFQSKSNKLTDIPACAVVKCITPYTITQDTITDCSFVASLCIASAYERNHGRKKGFKLITNIIYPQDSRGVPQYNPSGKYLVKLWVNGVLRKVTVDDTFPVGKGGRLLCSATSTPGEMWVSIIEKAYMKVNGGYDFPGSNSGIDLFALTGWLPEQIFFEEHRRSLNPESSKVEKVSLDSYQPSERVWQRLLSAHEFGDCLVTVSTETIGEALTHDEAERLGLVPGHAYAVLDVKEVVGVRLLQVKNPWARKRWKGPFSVDDSVNWTNKIKSAVGYDLEAASLDDNGVFWIDWTSICRYFRYVFINWNPALFAYRSVTHGEWKVEVGPANDRFNYGYNPQFTLSVKYPKTNSSGSSSPIVWVLLTRHVMMLESSESEGDYLTLHVYDDLDGRRVFYSTPPMYRGTYTNNPHTLVRFELPTLPSGTQKSYTLVLSQYLKKRDVRYTLNVYCSSTFELISTPDIPPHRFQIQGEWNPETAGGNLSLSTFYLNPQYSVKLDRPTYLHIQLEAPKDYAVDITLVKSDGNRVDSLPLVLEVLTSGAYRPGFCFAASKSKIPAGTYTLVVSTYEANQIGNFLLTVASSVEVERPVIIPAEGEGMCTRKVTGSWSFNEGTAVGCSNYGNYSRNPNFRFSTTAATTLILVRLIGTRSKPRPAINVSIFDADSNNHLPANLSMKAISSSGTFTDSTCGCTIKASLRPGSYFIVVSTFAPQECQFELILHSNLPIIEHF